MSRWRFAARIRGKCPFFMQKRMKTRPGDTFVKRYPMFGSADVKPRCPDVRLRGPLKKGHFHAKTHENHGNLLLCPGGKNVRSAVPRCPRTPGRGDFPKDIWGGRACLGAKSVSQAYGLGKSEPPHGMFRHTMRWDNEPKMGKRDPDPS